MELRVRLHSAWLSHIAKFPVRAERLGFLHRARLPRRVTTHCQAVAGLSRRICRDLNKCGMQLDVDLVEAAGLFHDIAKGAVGHAEAGCRLLASNGYGKIAEIVRWHMDLKESPPSRITELEVVYLADKLMDGPWLVGLSIGRRRALERKGVSAEVSANIGRRFDDAQRILELIEHRLGENLMWVLHG